MGVDGLLRLVKKGDQKIQNVRYVVKERSLTRLIFVFYTFYSFCANYFEISNIRHTLSNYFDAKHMSFKKMAAVADLFESLSNKGVYLG